MKINEADKGEIGKKKNYKRIPAEVKADFELVMEMCLTGKSRNMIRGEFKDTKPHRNYTLHWQTVDKMMRRADEEIERHTPRKDRSEAVKASKAWYEKIKKLALEAGDLRIAVSAQDKMDYHHISKQPDQINIQELRLQILGDGEGMQSMHICGDTIEPALVRYQYIGQDKDGNMVVWAEEELSVIRDKAEAESKVHEGETENVE